MVTVANSSPRGYNHLVLTEVFPAGWEILNTRFLTGGSVDNRVTGVNYQDIRDDRAYSYIDYLPAGKQVTESVSIFECCLPRPFLFASGLLRSDV